MMSIWVRHACAVPTHGCEEHENGALKADILRQVWGSNNEAALAAVAPRRALSAFLTLPGSLRFSETDRRGRRAAPSSLGFSHTAGQSQIF